MAAARRRATYDDLITVPEGRVAEIVEVRGEQSSPPYLVRFPDGHESLVFPGPDSVVEHHQNETRLSRRFLG